MLHTTAERWTTGMPHPLPDRRARLAAAAWDTMALAAALGASALAALTWLGWRTEFGAYDIGEGDAAFAWALWSAAAPAGLAWLAATDGLGGDRGATPGQARVGLHQHGPTRRRLLRLALHPLALPTWGWLSAVAFLLGGAVLAAPLAVVGLAVALGAIGSAALLCLRPDAPAVHDRLSGVRLHRDADA